MPLDLPGLDGICWPAPGVSMEPPLLAVRALGLSPSGPFFAGSAVATLDAPGRPRSPVGAHSSMEGGGGWSLLTLLAKPPSRDEGNETRDGIHPAILRFARAVPARAVLAVSALGIEASSAIAWATGAGDEARNIAFLSAHPWALDCAIDAARGGSDVRPALAEGADMDAVAAALLAEEGDAPPVLSRLARRLRGLAWRDLSLEGAAWMRRTAAAVSELPERLWPEAPADLPPGPRAHRPWTALMEVAPHALVVSRASGRAAGSVLGKVGDPVSYAWTLASRAGVDVEGVASGNEDWPAHAVQWAMLSVADMVRAAAEELVRPSCLAAGVPAPPLHETRVPLHHVAPGTAEHHALRLLVGDRSLPALCELSLRWHGRAAGIARVVSGIAYGNRAQAPRAMPDLELGNGHYATQLVGIAELAAEGAAGPDADGVDGLDHCVASYAADVLASRCVVLSIRRRTERGHERVSTAELRPFGPGLAVAQHRGPGNAEPDPVLDEALRDTVEGGIPGFDPSVLAAPGDPGPDLAASLSLPGSWERVRDAWAFALPRPLRLAGPDGVLAAAGIRPLAPDAPSVHHQGVETRAGIPRP